MGGLGDHAGEMIYILLAILLIVAVMVIVMTLSKTAKKSTNQKTAELNQQVANVDAQFFEDWDMGQASGAQVKAFIQSAKGKDCAVLVQTLALLGNQPTWGTQFAATTNSGTVGTEISAVTDVNKAWKWADIGGIAPAAGTSASGSYGGIATQTVSQAAVSTGNVAESTFNGTALQDAKRGQLPIVMIDLVDANAAGSHVAGMASGAYDIATAAFPVQTALKTTVYNSCLINYGTILKNAVANSGVSGEKYTSIMTDTGVTAGVRGPVGIVAHGWDTTTSDKSQTIAYLDGRFRTKQEFATSQSGINLRYDSTTDLNQSGKTMYISDTAKFKSYVLQDGADKYVGVVFIETK